MAEKRLRCGYTTGSCAAAASHAAVEMLLGGDDVEEVLLETPKGIRLRLAIEQICREPDFVSCAVRKDRRGRSGCDYGNVDFCPGGEENVFRCGD